MKSVQVFMKGGEGHAEVNGILKSIRHTDGLMILVSAEGHCSTEHHIPHSSIDFVRIFTIKGEGL